MEDQKATMTAKPMRPISPLEIGKKKKEDDDERDTRTLDQTFVATAKEGAQGTIYVVGGKDKGLDPGLVMRLNTVSVGAYMRSDETQTYLPRQRLARFG